MGYVMECSILVDVGDKWLCIELLLMIVCIESILRIRNLCIVCLGYDVIKLFNFKWILFKDLFVRLFWIVNSLLIY